jgi:hypothetical protein
MRIPSSNAELDCMRHQATVSPSVAESQTIGKCHQVDSDAEHPDRQPPVAGISNPVRSVLGVARPRHEAPAEPEAKVGGLPDTKVSSDTIVQ